MNLGELRQKTAAIPTGVSETSPVMVIVKDMTGGNFGKLFSIVEVHPEHHADADGSHTVWLEVEEY